MKDQRNAIDFGKMNIPKLFITLFVPTLLGMLAGALLNLADGIFVGRGVGSDALAAVNVAAPVFLIASGVALMFGSGASVVAGIS
jgi:Na+-driven multidrug efflux pump